MTQPQPPYVPGHQQPIGFPPAPPKKKSKLPWILGGIGAFLALCLGGVVLIGVTADTDTPDTPAGRAVAAASATPAPQVTTIVEAEPAPVAPVVPKDITMTGRGDKLLKPKLDPERAYVATITYSGGSNFIVTSIDSGGEQVDLLVNEIGKYSGSRPVGLREDETIAALKVEASGSWKIVLRDLSKAPQFTGKANGKGAAVYLIPTGTLGSLSSANITYKGSGNFIVTSYGDSIDLLVNEIGRYSGEVLLGSDALVLEIQADGAWTIQAT